MLNSPLNFVKEVFYDKELSMSKRCNILYEEYDIYCIEKGTKGLSVKCFYEIIRNEGINEKKDTNGNRFFECNLDKMKIILKREGLIKEEDDNNNQEIIEAKDEEIMLLKLQIEELKKQVKRQTNTPTEAKPKKEKKEKVVISMDEIDFIGI